MSSHQPLWSATENKERGENEFPLFWKRWFSEVLHAAGQGKNILLYGRETSPARWKMFLNILRAQPELERHEFCCMAVMGRPVCLLEQHARLVWPRKPSVSRWHAFAREFAQIAELIPFWHGEFGQDNVRLYADTSELPVATGLSAGHLAALEYLGASLSPRHRQADHYLALASREARHILLASEVQNNSWPTLDRTQLISHLQEFEQKAAWDCRPACHPKYRAALVNHGKIHLPWLEAFLQLEQGALSCPAELEPETPWENYSGLSDETIRNFTESLPKSMADILLERYTLDSRLLGNAQKRICKRLAGSAQNDTKHRGNISAPNALVSVLTLARNQEHFISECIESVLSQKTTFVVQHIILDHCSTDDTPNIIRKYADKYPSVRPVLLSQWLNGQNVKGLFSRCRTPYAALCDGDDYFSDPFKLQKQVDFLEAHPQCALCFHPVDVLYEDGSPRRVYPPENLLPGGIRTFYSIKDLFFANLMQTNSVMYRWRFSDGLPEWFDPTLVPGDWYWHILHAETGLIGYQRDHMSVYRRHKGSLYASAEEEHVNHRALHGLEELRTYHVCNQHFQGKFYADLSKLSNGVLADFLSIYMRTGNDELLVKAAKISPEFTHEFLRQIKLN